jgi:hypothetical protein
MNRNDCVATGERVNEDPVRWVMDSSLLNFAVPAAHPFTGLPLKGYLHARRNLAFEAMHFPLGFPVRILSNSPRVLDAASESWSCFTPAFHGQPLEVLFDVRPGVQSGDSLPPAPSHTVKGSLIVQVSDVDNFFIADMRMGRAMGRVTPVAAGSSRYLRYHVLEAAVLCLIATTRAVPVHAACVEVCGRGILLCADSGEGKSTLAYAGARAGWTYVTDDATYIPMHREDRMAIGNCHRIRFRPSGAELFPELAGRPLTPRAAGKPSVEVPTSEWPWVTTATSTRIDHVIFLNRRYADTHELIPVRDSAVWPWFTQHLMSPPETRPTQEAALAGLLSAGVFELRYSDLDWAVDRINQLARKGH